MFERNNYRYVEKKFYPTLYHLPIRTDAISVKEYRRIEMVLIQQKVALKCVSGYRTVSAGAVCVLAGLPLIKIVADSVVPKEYTPYKPYTLRKFQDNLGCM